MPPPLALYIHIPWCIRKCPYCDFNSHAQPAELDQDAYVQALLKDLELEAERVPGRQIQTVFIGGGTPSLFSGPAIDRVLTAADQRLGLAPGAEITLEANPGAAEAGRFRAYRAAGVNRLSLGVQSFDPAALKALGRIHSRAEAVRAAEMARAAGFDNLNLDLMYGLPGQTPALARQDLQAAIALAPEHLSYYQLTIEPHTAFHAAPPATPDDDRLAAIEDAGHTLLEDAGYARYEVSAFAQPGRQCRHNLNYWRFGDYLGIGAGAHGKITTAEGAQRRWRKKAPQEYLKTAGTPQALDGAKWLDEPDRLAEFMLNALRLKHGFPAALFQARTGLPAALLAPRLDQARALGLIETAAERIRPTDRGYRFLNDLIGLFLDPDA